MSTTRFEDLEPDWLDVASARKRILSRARPLPSLELPLDESRGHALAEDLDVRVTLPPWDNSAMDGYATRSADVRGAHESSPVELDVVGVVRAGDHERPTVGEGQAVRIMTGAPLPPGADGVVRVEDTDAEEDGSGRVRIFDDRDAGRNVRPGGEDLTAGEPLLRKGATLGSGRIGLLAAQGFAQVPVHRPPVVAILPNGDELADADAFDAVRDGRAIPESNGPMLAAGVRSAGATPRLLPIARDRTEDILDRLDRARDADVLVTVGGASMGEADLFKRVLADRGFRLDFWRVRIRPGTPFSLGELPTDDGAVPVFGLPGNPGSAFVTFEILVRPYLLALGGHRRRHRSVVEARSARPLESPARLTHFFRVRLDAKDDGGLLARLTGPQGSGLVHSVGRADGLAVVPEGVERLDAGDPVRVVLLRDGPGWRARPGF